jgi:hypothetical protein
MRFRHALLVVAVAATVGAAGFAAPANASAVPVTDDCRASCQATFDAEIARCDAMTGSQKSRCAGAAWAALVRCGFGCGWGGESTEAALCRR